MTNPKIDPINTFLIDRNPSDLIMLLSNQAIKVIKATANITPGIAYPEIDNVERKLRVLFFETLLPQFDINANVIKTRLDKVTKYKVFNKRLITLISKKFSGNFIVQYNICPKGNKKLKKNNKKQNEKAKKEFTPDSFIFFFV